MSSDEESPIGWNWFRVPMALYEHLGKIDRAAVPVYIVLAKHANSGGEAWPGHETIAKATGLSGRSVRRCLETLKKVGLIEPKRRRRQTTVYLLPGFKTGQGLPVKESLTGQNLHQDRPHPAVKTGQNLLAYREQEPVNYTKNHTKSVSEKKFTKPTLQEITTYCKERRNQVDPQQFLDHYESNGWRVGRNAMKDWRAAVRTWEKNDFASSMPHAPVEAPYKEF